MTATSTPYRSELPSGRDGFAQLLHAEWTKLRTVRGWAIGLLAAIVLTLLVGLLGPLGSTIACQGPNGQPCDHSRPTGPGGEAVSDTFYFLHQPLAGNGSVTVRVTSLTGLYAANGAVANGQDLRSGMQSGVQPWAKAGIIVKDGTTVGSAYAAVMVTGDHGVRMQHDYTEDVAGPAGKVSATDPRWLRLTRSGDVLTGYASADGTNWSEVGTANLAGLPSTVQAGLFVASPGYSVITESFGGGSGSGGPTLATAAFDNVDVQGTLPQGTWAGDEIGTGGEQRAGTGFQPTSGGFTVSGSGDIAPVVADSASAGKTVENTLVGGFAGLIPVIVVATMFTTSEYRRGLLRITLAATPRRGRVLAAKALVIGAAAFVTGLAAALITVPLVESVERDKGFYLYPVKLATELRVIGGTAALFAVAAVLTLAVGTMFRRSAGAVTAVIVAIVLPYLLAVASVLPAGAAQWLTRLTPAAAFAIQQSMVEYPQVTASYTPAEGYFPLSPWGGFAVLCGYAALAIGAAFILLRRRDA